MCSYKHSGTKYPPFPLWLVKLGVSRAAGSLRLAGAQDFITEQPPLPSVKVCWWELIDEGKGKVEGDADGAAGLSSPFLLEKYTPGSSSSEGTLNPPDLKGFWDRTALEEGTLCN